jgi:hypothetical protein
MSYPEIGSLWKYTGMSPNIRHRSIGGERYMLSPVLEIVPESYIGEINLRFVDNRQRTPVRYDEDLFYKFFTPYRGPAHEQLISFQASVGIALFQGITKDEIHDLLVTLEI